MKPSKLLFLLLLLSIPYAGSYGQKTKAKKQTTQKSKTAPAKKPNEINGQDDHSKVKDIIAFLGFMLNNIGSDSTSSRDKDVLITESYSKIFRDGKVQVEDDLDEDRKVITNKDVVAYLKDVDFFFRDVAFEFSIDDIKESTLPDGQKFYKVSSKRNLTGVTADGEKVTNVKPRFIEINYNPEDQDLKIVSIYTNEFNEKEALTTWWNDLSYEWKAIFVEKTGIGDSVQLQDIKNVTSIQELDLSGNLFIQNIEPLGQLLDLKLLSLANTNIIDLTPIRNLTSLVELDLSNTKVQDLSPLKYASNLQRLNLGNTLVSNINVLERMESLKSLDLRGTPVNDFSALTLITDLTYLNLKRTQIADLSVVSHFLNLIELNVSGTPVHELKPVESLIGLQSLFIDSTLVENIAVLSNLRKLRVLHANSSLISNLHPLKDIPALERIYCDQTAVTKSMADAFIAAKPGVLVIYDSKDLQNWWNDLSLEWQHVLSKSAKISINPVKEELARVTNLDSIDVTGNKAIRNLEALRKLSKIRIVRIAGTAISDLAPIKDHRNISELDISETAVSSLAAVATFPNLKILRADRTPIDGIELLRNVSSLQKLYVDHTAINDITASEFLDANSSCLVVYKTVHLKRWWKDLSPEWKEVFRSQLGRDTTTTRENLHRLTQQRKLVFTDVLVNELNSLGEFVRLEHLEFSGTAVNSIPSMENLRKLKVLHATNGPLRNINAIHQLDRLEVLDISNTPVEELDPIQRIDLLKTLNCSGTQIRKLDPLEGLPNLELLDCSNTKVSNLNPLLDLPLKTLKCYNTRISAREIEKFRERKKECNVIYYR